MALRSGYKGIKKLAKGLKMIGAGILGVDTVALSENFFTTKDQAVLGSVNVLPSMGVETYTVSGVTFKRNADLSIEINGTSTDEIYYNITTGNTFLQSLRGNWIARLGVDSISGVSYGFVKSTSGTWTLSGANLEQKIVLTDDEHLSGQVRVYVGAAKTFDHVIIRPTLISEDFPYTGYIQHALTNIELTASAADQKTAINAIITAATGAADFAAFKTAMGAITPVTRSLSKEASPEDVPEEVIEEEKTVTKKTTRKTTVKEGE